MWGKRGKEKLLVRYSNRRKGDKKVSNHYGKVYPKVKPGKQNV